MKRGRESLQSGLLLASGSEIPFPVFILRTVKGSNGGSLCFLLLGHLSTKEPNTQFSGTEEVCVCVCACAYIYILYIYSCLPWFYYYFILFSNVYFCFVASHMCRNLTILFSIKILTTEVCFCCDEKAQCCLGNSATSTPSTLKQIIIGW